MSATSEAVAGGPPIGGEGLMAEARSREAIWRAAVSFAARAHHHQVRKDGHTPFIAHPMRVAMTVLLTFGCDDPVAIAAALLHDTIEDTVCDYDDIESAFGDEVARCVATLTKNMILPEAEREAEYEQRLGSGDWRARLVKLADCYDNLVDAHSHARRRKMVGRSLRAVDLAIGDAPSHEPTRRAIEALRALVAQNT